MNSLRNVKLPRWARRTIVAVITLAAVLCGGGYGLYRYAPTYVRHKLAERAPYVFVDGSIEVHRHEVVLHHVRVEKPNVHGTFPLVYINVDDESVHIVGGDLDYTLGEKDKPGSGEATDRHTIEATGLSAVIHRGAFEVQLHQASVLGGEVCFDNFILYRHFDDAEIEGQVTVAYGSSEYGRPCVSKDGKHAKLGMVYVPADWLPGIARYFPDEFAPENFMFKDVEYLDTRDSDGSRLLTIAEAGSGQTTAFNVRVSYVKSPQGTSRVDAGAREVRFLANRVFEEPLTVKLVWTSFDPEHVRDQPVTVHMGSTSITANLSTFSVSGDEDCNEWVRTLPDELKTKAFDGLRFNGKLGFDVHLRPDVKLSMHNSCKAVCPVKSIEALKKPFEHMVYMDYGEGDEATVGVSGPGTPGWTPFKDIASVMPLAVINLEDKAFPTHNGFVPAALENSLKADVEKGRFVRGGSTITMQLAKNVFLHRSKTIGRKVQEAFLTMALESCLSKDQIMELYLNVVQYGPNLYGIGQASQSYFQKKPADLTAEEAFYLASVLPRPSKAPPPNPATMKRVASLMQTLVNRGSLDPNALVPTADSDVEP